MSIMKHKPIYTSIDLSEPQSLLKKPTVFTSYSLVTLQKLVYPTDTSKKRFDIEWITTCLEKDRIQDRINDEDILQYSEHRIIKEIHIEHSSSTSSLHSLKNSASTASLHSLKISASTASLHSLKISASTASLHSLKISASTTSLHSLKNSPSTTSLHSLKNSPSTASLHSLKNSPSTTSLHSLKNSPSTTSLHSLKNSASSLNVKKNTPLPKTKPIHKNAWK
jgi:hypothetical protein